MLLYEWMSQAAVRVDKLSLEELKKTVISTKILTRTEWKQK
jgi:hypothetical protein